MEAFRFAEQPSRWRIVAAVRFLRTIYRQLPKMTLQEEGTNSRVAEL